MDDKTFEEIVWRDLDRSASDDDLEILYADLDRWRAAVIRLKGEQQSRITGYREDLSRAGAKHNSGKWAKNPKQYWVLVRNIKNRQAEAITNSQDLETKLIEIKAKLKNDRGTQVEKSKEAKENFFVREVLRDIRQESVSQPELTRLYKQLVAAAVTTRALIQQHGPPPEEEYADE